MRDGVNAADGYGGRATVQEAKRWQRLSNAARVEVLALRSGYSVA
jgi:hypothetical protein